MTTASEALKLAETERSPTETASPVEAAPSVESAEPPAPTAVVISLADGRPLAQAEEVAVEETVRDASAPEESGESPETPPEDAPVATDEIPAAARSSLTEPPVSEEAASEEPVEQPVEETGAEDDAPPRIAGPLFLVPGGSPQSAPPPPVLPATAPTGPARARAAANPLLAAAGPALTHAVRLSEQEEPPTDPEALGFELTRLLAEYETVAAQAGLAPGVVQVGRFALAATLDDLLRARPWATQCVWLRQGLAAAGPERFFDLMRAMLKNPGRHRHALELFYACLSLGFEGRFRDRSQGGHELARIRDQLYRVLRRLAEAPERALSPAPPKAQKNADAVYHPPSREIPAKALAFWLIFIAIFGWFAAAWWLEGRTNALSARLEAMVSGQSVATARPAPLPPPAGPELAARVTEALAPDIRAAAVEVLAGADGALVVRLSGGAVFPAGSDAVRAFYRAVIDRVGQALAKEKGRVLVVAHTDAWALATDKFPTARALTEARAEAVRTLLEKRLGGLRLSAEGRGDGEPIDSNDTPGGRAANRRVDIRLYP
jgi:type VI secretion system protein ImpK